MPEAADQEDDEEYCNTSGSAPAASQGKYRHSRRKVVSVMCHRFQNSVTEALRYGESKVHRQAGPKSRATPAAMSQ